MIHRVVLVLILATAVSCTKNVIYYWSMKDLIGLWILALILLGGLAYIFIEWIKTKL